MVWELRKLCAKVLSIQGFWECLSVFSNPQTPISPRLSIRHFSFGLMANMHCICRVALKSKDKDMRVYTVSIGQANIYIAVGNLCSHMRRLRSEEKILYNFISDLGNKFFYHTGTCCRMFFVLSR